MDTKDLDDSSRPRLAHGQTTCRYGSVFLPLEGGHRSQEGRRQRGTDDVRIDFEKRATLISRYRFTSLQIRASRLNHLNRYSRFMEEAGTTLTRSTSSVQREFRRRDLDRKDLGRRSGIPSGRGRGRVHRVGHIRCSYR